MATNKEALVLVLDIGPGMSEAAPGFDSPLQIASDILQMVVQRKMFQESKDELALILYGTDESQNDLADESNYQHISVVFPLGPVNWHLFEEIQKIQPGNQPADLIDAVVVAADHLRRETEGKRGFNAKRILIFSNVADPLNDHSLQTILDSLRRQEITIDAIGPSWGEDEDDHDNDQGGGGGDQPSGSDAPTTTAMTTDGNDHSASARPTTNGHSRHQKPLTQQQKTNVRLINRMVNATEGSLFTFREALSILSLHQSKTVRPTPTKYLMEIAELKLHICTYIQVKENKPAIFRLKKVYARDPTTEIKVDRGRYTKDEQDEELEKDQLTDGYRYGTTFVPMSKEMLEDMKYQSEKCFSVIGFTNASNVRQSLYLGDALYEVIAEPTYTEETHAFAGLVQAMYDTNMVAIVRRCFSARSSPEIGFLRPHISHDHICMYYVKLPFAEDVREFNFENLDALKRNQPSEEQLKTMDDLITNMDLTHADRGEEALRPETVFNPYIQRMFQCIARRAVTPDEPLSLSNTVMEMNETLLQSISMRSQRLIDTLQEQFPLRETGRKQKITTGDALFGSKKARLDEEEVAATTDQPVETNSFEALAAAQKKATLKTIGTVTPVEDFQSLIQQGTISLSDLCKQMATLIVEFIHNSHGDALFDKTMLCLKSLRDVCIQKLEPKIFNDLIGSIKRQSTAIDGRKDFWKRLVQDQISLITSEECIESNVIPVEAKKFLEEETPEEVMNRTTNNDDQDAEEDLFDLI